jgi:hypothetical protein
VHGSVDFGGGGLGNTFGGDPWIACFTTAGAHAFSHKLHSTGSASADGVAVGTDGRAYLSGHFIGELGPGFQPADAVGNIDGFLVGYEATGVPRFWVHINSSGPDEVHDVTVGPDGPIHAVGMFGGDFEVLGTPLESMGWTNVLLLKLMEG